MIIHNLLLVPPYVVEKICDNAYSFLPYKLIVWLQQCNVNKRSRYDRRIIVTSVKAGAEILRYFFHSSRSDATILCPKKRSSEYNSIGLGNFKRAVMISCRPAFKTERTHEVKRNSYLDYSSIRNEVVRIYLWKRAHLESQSISKKINASAPVYGTHGANDVNTESLVIGVLVEHDIATNRDSCDTREKRGGTCRIEEGAESGVIPI